MTEDKNRFDYCIVLYVPMFDSDLDAYCGVLLQPETLFQSPWFLMNLRELADAKRLGL